MAIHILGISAYFHDSAACLITDGKIMAAAQQERFSRIKHDPSFPLDAIKYCLSSQNLKIQDLYCVVYYEDNWLKFQRLVATCIEFAPKSFFSFVDSMPSWLTKKLFIKRQIIYELSKLLDFGGKGSKLIKIEFGNHHKSHAASAFYPSPFEKSAILCIDGVGEWETTSFWNGIGTNISKLFSMRFPHSLGLLYSAFTQYLGFKVNSGEYKLMGLAPYGNPLYVNKILDNLIKLNSDGTFRLNMTYFDYPLGYKMVSSRFEDLFGDICRKPESPLTQKHMDIANSIQLVIDETVIRLAKNLQKKTDAENLCLAGGVALNCVTNGKIIQKNIFKNIWIQPAAGDAGCAVGAALSIWYENFQPHLSARKIFEFDGMNGGFLGPNYSTTQVCEELDKLNAKYRIISDSEIPGYVAQLISDGNVIGWFSGRMEFGPRALGARSILGDPRNPEMQSQMNIKIKFRESFRPFAPSILHENVSDYFDDLKFSPYMLVVSQINQNKRLDNKNEIGLSGIDRLKVKRSTIPAVTHVDYSARVQTVHSETNPKFHALIKSFYKITGCPVLINTSFNVRGEPIVCSPSDAYRCFMRSNIDFLVIENAFIDKRDQHKSNDDLFWKKKYELD